MELEQTNEVISTKDWIITILISSIPIIGIIMLCVWAFGDSASKTKANWSKAMLIWTLVAILLMMFYWLFIAVMFVSTM